MMNESPLFLTTYCGNPINVGHANETELARLTETIDSTAACDVLKLWSLVAVREPAERGTKVHALGWRAQLANTWITSPLVAVDMAAGAVTTTSGHVYLLAERDELQLEPALRGHLAYALRMWGFDDVRV